ncbi:MAG: hypothetical protein ACRDHZ_00695, partial [Ktedonobacteraceae bacterium]
EKLMAIDDYSPMTVGDTLIPLSVQTSFRDGSPIPLVGATLSLVMVSGTGVRQVGTGVWTIDNAAAGQAHYAWSAADVATAGTWSIQVEYTIGGQPEHLDTKLLIIGAPL